MNCYHFICELMWPGISSYIKYVKDLEQHGCQMAEQFQAIIQGYAEL